MDVEVLTDPEALAQRAAVWLVDTLAALPGPRSVCLSGGSTPQRLYQLLAQAPFLERMPWDRISWFWGDERFVPPDDARSNLRMVKEAMLDHAPVLNGLIHPIHTVGRTPDEAARLYAADLASHYGADSLDPARPLFDVTLLGLGTNGHTASLFPGEPVLDNHTAWAAAVTPPGEPTRITLTYPALNSSRHVAFLIAGAEKHAMLNRLREADRTIPAGRVAPSGDLRAFVDAEAERG